MSMRIEKRWGIPLVACLVPVVTLMAAPQWASETWDDFVDYPELHRHLHELEDVRKEMNAESDLVMNRIHIKESILDEVTVNAMTLKDAATRFLMMDRDRPGVSNMYQQPYRAGSEMEIATISVIRHLRGRLSSKDFRIAATVKRVVAEFEREFGYHPPE